jgi:pimeloyl-ACP methyl ester carboxylesterase
VYIIRRSRTLKLGGRILLMCGAFIGLLLVIEHLLEVRDVIRYTPGENFAQVADSRIRYRQLGAPHLGNTVVFLSGLSGSIEQADQLQRAVAEHEYTLAYDRAGSGFTEGSDASTALEQANELVGLLKALRVNEPVVLVAYSLSAAIARVFAGQYPQLTGGLYLIEPNIPEINLRFPTWHSPRRSLFRPVMSQLLMSMIGEIRLKQRLENWNGPTSLVEQRAQAILARRAHNWAVTREWYFLTESLRQAMDAPVPASLPMEIAYTEGPVEDETVRAVHQVYATFASRSTRGELYELGDIRHEQLMSSRAAIDQLAARIVILARNGYRASRSSEPGRL